MDSDNDYTNEEFERMTEGEELEIMEFIILLSCMVACVFGFALYGVYHLVVGC